MAYGKELILDLYGCDGFLFLKYWKRLSFLNKCSQVIIRKPIIYLLGFCSRNRGLHWNWRR